MRQNVGGFTKLIGGAAVAVLVGSGIPAAADDMNISVEERLGRAEQTIDDLQDELAGLKKGGDGDPSTFRVFWKNGIHLETPDKKFTAKIGGRVHNDWAFGTMQRDLKTKLGEDFKNGVEFRRARLYIQGTMYDNFEYKAQYDFAGGDADFKDVYMGMKNIPCIGGVRIGQFKEPFSLEELTSSNYITFLERSLPNEAFSPSRNTGIMVHNSALDNRMTYAVGYFRDTDSFGDESSDQEFVFTGRVTGTPYYQDNGRGLLHLGVSGRYRQPGSGEVSFDQKPEIHLADDFVDTGDIAANNVQQLGAELAYVQGPLSIQGEYFRTWTDTSGNSDDPQYDGMYLFASYFLTGESRPYKTSNGTFSGVKPKKNLDLNQGTWGAWEVAARYSQVDLDDEGILGGELRNTTVGMNWYLNPNMRIMANWVHAHRKAESYGDMFAFRFQFFL